MVTYISIEPVANRVRAQSELDASPHTGKPGLMFPTTDEFTGTAPDPAATSFAAGKVSAADGVATLTFDVVPETFRNGARPVVRVMFRTDRPHEVGFRVSSGPGSTPMRSCVLSATMGNYARLRRVHLADEVADSLKL
jgi:hypothetical protein